MKPKRLTTITTRTVVVVLLISANVAVTGQSKSPRPREIVNVAAFARLYGVVRYFYPGDAATALDWNRFAVYGVNRVRAARDTRALEAILNELFAPLGPGIVVAAKLPAAGPTGRLDPSLVAWMHNGPYLGRRTNRGTEHAMELRQSVRAADLRGKTIRLRGQVRVMNPAAPGRAGLFLTIYRNEETGFSDDMDSRPIRQTEWREYVIEGNVADDATEIYFGTHASGAMTADFDAIALEVRDANGAWTPVSIEDAGFEAPPDPFDNTWFAVDLALKTSQLTRPTEGAAEGRRFLSVTVNDATVGGEHSDFNLTTGLKARVPLGLTDAEARAQPNTLGALRTAIGMVSSPSGRSETDVRLADVVVAWNVFRHFYPYWTEARVDWDSRLRPQLEIAYMTGNTRESHRNALRALVADARDGHARVIDTTRESPASLPIQLRAVDGGLVITASSVPELAPIGAVVTSIDGVAADARLADEMRLASGTTQWKPWRAILEIRSCRKGSVMKLGIKTGATPVSEKALPCNATQLPAAQVPSEHRPEDVAELVPGIWYVNLTRATMDQIRPQLEKLAAADGIVFDLRGYPTDAGFEILPHLIERAENDRWMHIAKITGPFGQVAGWRSFGWNLKPASPHFSGKRVFLTNGRAISYAESVIGYVADHKLATIIGSPTAGTNGNVHSFEVPGGFKIFFTGMRVTRHDGRTPFHLIGVQPDIPLEPTLAGIGAGRDELLERALAFFQSRKSDKKQR